MYATYNNNSMIPIDSGYGYVQPFEPNQSPESHFPDEFSFNGYSANIHSLGKTNSYSRPASNEMNVYHQTDYNRCYNQQLTPSFQALAPRLPPQHPPTYQYQPVPFHPPPSAPFQAAPPRQPQQPPLLRWKAVDFMYTIYSPQRQRECTRIALPINFDCVPLCNSSSDRYPTPSIPCNVSFSCSNHAMAQEIMNLSEFIKDKVVLELGSGLAVPSLLSLANGAKYVYVTDGNKDIVDFMPLIMRKNNICSSKYAIKRLLFSAKHEMKHILEDLASKQLGVHCPDILFASDVLKTPKMSIDFFDCVLFFLVSHQKHQQKIIFEQKRQKQLSKESKEQAQSPNIKQQFDSFTTRNGNFMDINYPITNGGNVPSLMRPQIRKHAATNRFGHYYKKSGDESVSILSRYSDDDTSTNTNFTTHKIVNLVDSSDEDKDVDMAEYRSPGCQPGKSSVSAIETVVNAPMIHSYHQHQSHYHNETNRRFKQNLRIPKFIQRRQNNVCHEDEDKIKEEAKNGSPVLILGHLRANAENWKYFSESCNKHKLRIKCLNITKETEVWIVSL